MTGVTYETGNAHSSRAPDFTFKWKVHVVPLLFIDIANVRTNIFIGQQFIVWLL